MTTDNEKKIIAFNSQSIILNCNLEGTLPDYNEVATFPSVEQAQAYIDDFMAEEYVAELETDPLQFHEVNDFELFFINSMEDHEISKHHAAMMLLKRKDTPHYNRLLREFYVVAEFNNHEIAREHENRILMYFGLKENGGIRNFPDLNLKKNIASLREILDEMEQDLDEMEQEVAKEVAKI